MTSSRPGRAAAPVLVAALLAACNGGNAPWLTMPSRDGHGARYFPIEASSNHGTVSCDDCHGTYDTFRKFDCVTCHAGTAAEAASLQAKHVNQAGFPDLGAADRSVPSQACLLCHSDGTAFGIDPAVHTQKYFPIGAATKHATARCTDCHSQPTDRKVLGCAGCHGHEQAAMASAHAAVKADASTGYAFSSMQCVRCHADGQRNSVSGHGRFLITAGTKHGPTTNGQCLRCHDAWRTDKSFGADFTQKNCLGCHTQADTDPRHRGEGGYQWSTPKCLSCHPTGAGGGN